MYQSLKLPIFKLEFTNLNSQNTKGKDFQAFCYQKNLYLKKKCNWAMKFTQNK